MNLYVELGHGRDYAWSATSAGQDITDTFAVPLCDPGGGKPTIDSTYYVYRGSACRSRCSTRTISWTPNAADSDAGRHARRSTPSAPRSAS